MPRTTRGSVTTSAPRIASGRRSATHPAWISRTRPRSWPSSARSGPGSSGTSQAPARTIARSSSATRARIAEAKAWQRKVYEAGYLALAWPREYGGQGADIMRQTIVNEEMVRARAPG